MKITSTLAFAAAPPRVADMFVNPGFAEHIAAEIPADNVTVTVIDKGMTAVFTVESPDVPMARQMLGQQVTVTQTVTWEDAQPDGSRVGRMTMTLAGVPAAVDGPLRLKASPTGSLVDYEADLTVRIPLIGKKLEKTVEQYLSEIIAAWEQIGNSWLSEQDRAESTN